MKDMQRLTIVILAMLASCARELPPAAEFEAADGVAVDIDVWAGELGASDAADTFGEAEVDAAEGSDVADVPDAPDVAETADGSDTADVPDAVTPDVEPDVLDVVQTCPAPCTAPDPCQTASCNPKTGNCETAPKADGAGCDDGQACTQGSTCQAGQCQGGAVAPPCGCTADSDCAAQDDGKLCNGSFYCDKSAPIWACKLNPGSVVSCQDPGEPCKSAKCLEPGSPGGDATLAKCAIVLAEDGTPCDDGKAWTVGEACISGQCLPSADAKLCKDTSECAAYEDGDLCNGTLFCNKALGVCQVLPKSVVVCPSAADTTCQAMHCQKDTGKCALVAKPDQVACDDGLLCTTGEACMSGICTATVGAKTCQCAADSDCGKYEDGDACNGKLFCNLAKGACEVNPATVVVCPTGLDSACSHNVCDKATGACGLSFAPTATACDADGSPCTPYDHCEAGKCVADTSICQCTGDSDCAGWEDGDLCNGTLYCEKKSGTCAVNPATVKSCPSAGDSACSKNICVALSGVCAMTTVGEGGGCDDGSVCTAGDACKEGKCSPGGTLMCDDGNGCTTDSCDKTQGCVYLANSLACTDGDACTEGDKCAATVCSPGLSKACDDGNPCTSDSCDKTLGCVYLANSLTCTDGDACTEGDKCVAKACSPGSSKACDDGNGCTSDSCDKTQGCVYLANSLTCTDGDACTEGDKCAAKACSPGLSKACDDGNGCTSDSCDPKTGCKNTPIADTTPCGTGQVCKSGTCVVGCSGTGACDDSNACTTSDVCANATCKGTALTCDDKNPCTTDTCDKATGCVFSKVADNASCDDGKPCTTADVCKSGGCTGTPKTCDDASACTTDTCDPATGACGNVSTCDDQNACTTDTCDSKLGCGHSNVADTTGCGGSKTCLAGKCIALGGCTDKDVWQKTFGGNAIDEFHALVPGKLGGIYGVGSTSSIGKGEDDFWLAEVDSTGALVKEDTFGTTASDVAEAATLTSGGALVMAGSSWGGGKGLDDGYVVLRAVDGKVTEVFFGGAGSDWFKAVANSPDGGVWVVGGTTSAGGNGGRDAWIVKLDKDLAVVWEKKLGGTKDDDATGVVVLGDGTAVVVGSTLSFGAGKKDGRVWRMDGAGKVVWDFPYGSVEDDAFAAVCPDGMGGVVAVGTSAKNGAGNPDGWAMALTKDGDFGWNAPERFYGGAKADGLTACAVGQLEQTLLTGSTTNAKGDTDGWLMAVDGSGVKQWEKGYAAGNGTVARAVAQVGVQVVVAGTREEAVPGAQGWVSKVDGWGNGSCAESGGCFAMGLGGCSDGNPCTAEVCEGGSCTSLGIAGAACTDAAPCTIGGNCAGGQCEGYPLPWQVSVTVDLKYLHVWGAVFPLKSGGISIVALPGNALMTISMKGNVTHHGDLKLAGSVVCGSPSGRFVSGSDTSVRMHDPNGEPAWTHQPSSKAAGSMRGCAWSPDGDKVTAVFADLPYSAKVVRLTAGGTELWTATLSFGLGGYGAVVAESGDWVVVVGETQAAIAVLDKGGVVKFEAKSIFGIPGQTVNALLAGENEAVIGTKAGIYVAKYFEPTALPVGNVTELPRYCFQGTGAAGFRVTSRSAISTFDWNGKVLNTVPAPPPSEAQSLFRVSGLRAADYLVWRSAQGVNWVQASDKFGHLSCAAAGLCPQVQPTDCDDGSLCTTDNCDAKVKCTNTPNTNPCTDNNPCTHTDACTSGKCLGKPTPAPNCAMTPLPPATLDLGCKDDTDCATDETPVHSLTLPAYALDTKEVSNLQYAACVSANKCTAPASSSSACTYGKAGKDSHPVNCITYDQALSYCKWAYADGRLPTEAEWERAARGTDGRKYPWGSATPDATLANFLTSATKAVGLLLAGKSQDGLLDLAGNVREWVADWYSPSAYSSTPVPPTGPTTGTERVLRGGGYSSPASALRGSARDHADPTLQAPTIGFRCARSGN